MDLSVTKVLVGGGKTPFHRLENQLAVLLDTTGENEGAFYPAGTYLRAKADVKTLIMEDPGTRPTKVAKVVGDGEYIQGILVHDVTVKYPGDQISVSMAFGGVLYPHVMDLVNPTALTVSVVDTNATDQFKKNFEWYGVRKASELDNKL